MAVQVCWGIRVMVRSRRTGKVPYIEDRVGLEDASGGMALAVCVHGPFCMRQSAQMCSRSQKGLRRGSTPKDVLFELLDRHVLLGDDATHQVPD